ncbi:LacI family DNA-binding transcriptional regulator [Nonomuraea sp. NPDC050663]|uniref:LacI family DNA-binding transcriptional regulator n=1 Tax=Nonomuraea sp. NPDC050663 TaxID=3364370 RepID=UPI003796B717
MKRPTIADIARRAGVSKGAVSYALNGQPGVSEATRARVRAIAAEIGWQPSLAARSLSGARAQAIGLVVCRPARFLGVEPFFMELISGIESELGSCALMLQTVPDHRAELEIYRRWWGEGRVDGVILVDLHADDIRVPALQELGLPAVVMGHPSVAGSLTSVWSDEVTAMRETVGYLTALGHRRIARVAGLPTLMHTEIRDRAFAGACADLEHRTVHTDYTGEHGARATRRLLGSAARPTAILYDNDIMTVAGLSVAQEMGLSVPGELSLVAWDDSPLCQVVRPPLTAVSRDVPAFGAHAARRLLAVIDGEQPGSFEDEAARLTPRGSTARPV